MLECLLINNDCYKKATKIKPKGVMVHSTGANNPNLSRYVQPVIGQEDYEDLIKKLGKNQYRNDWNQPNLNVCVHGFIGKLADGTIEAIQTLPWDYKGWHCYKGINGSGNNTYISFEICEDNLYDKEYFEKVYKEAVKFTASLCKEFGFDPLGKNVIICHKEGNRLGIASNHSDVEHWFKIYNVTMDDFRNDVKKQMDSNESEEDEMIYKTYNDVPEYYQYTIKKLMDMGALKGTGNGEINVTETYCRIMVTLDRMGKL